MNHFLIIRKVIQDIVLVVFVVVFFYIIFRLMPGNPVDIFLRGLKHPSVQEKIRIEKELGLYGGKFNLFNFVIYLKDMFTFNLGRDYFNLGESVLFEVSQALPYTLLLFGTAAILSFVIGLPLGIYTSFIRGKKSEKVIITSTNLLNSIPFFVIAIIFYLYFAGYYRIFPLKSIFPIADLVNPTLGSLGFVFYSLALPILSLVIVEAAGHLLTMRAAMVSVLGEDFITTARAKGVKEKSIMFHHAARNAMIPVSTRMALELAFLMSGAVVVEIIFSIHGMGYLLYEATLNEDYPVTQGALFIISLIVIVTYSFIDFIHAWLDPRIKV